MTSFCKKIVKMPHKTIVIICIVLFTLYCHKTSSFEHKSHLRVKREKGNGSERWIWGTIDITEPKIEIETTTDTTVKILTPGQSGITDEEAVEKETEKVCNRPDPEKPDFSAPGRSISVVKCYEYIWQIKLREELSRREVECQSFLATYLNAYYAIGGRDANPGEFPHMGGIGWQAVEGTWIFKCGASLISEKWALTAAHCTNSGSRDTRIADPVPKIIRFGDKNIIDKYSNGIYPLDRNISRIIRHPLYQSPKKYYDIALMELDEEITFDNNAQPACLWNSFDVGALGNKASVTGWGIVESGSQRRSPVLQVADVDFIDSATCNGLLKPMCNRLWCGIDDTQICAGKLAGGVDACQGDSGGPLSVRIPLPVSAEGAMHHVVGVTSFSCALKDTPGVYTRVSSFMPWIESIQGDNDSERWSWGTMDNTTPNNMEIETSTDTTVTRLFRIRQFGITDEESLEKEKKKVCNRADPEKPDFSAPGRRISVVKCYEYIWQIKLREERSRREVECRSFLATYLNTYFVIGGRDAKLGEFPQMGGIGWQSVEGTWLFKCGASLISEKWALTAAHCTNSGGRDTRIADPVPKIIRFGVNNIINNMDSNDLFKLDRNISRIIRHPLYQSPKKYYDISLMELDREIPFDYNVQPACLWNSFDIRALGNNASVTGWGLVESGSQENSLALQVADVHFIDSAMCDSLLRPMCNRHWCGINDTQICAGKLAGGVDTCQGDSGGPLSVRILLPVSAEGAMHYVVGVTSFGFGCALEDRPGVYTRVSSFVRWIESIVWPS